MTAVIRKTLWAALALAALSLSTGCSPTPPKPDGGADGGGNSEQCIDDSDCPDPLYFFCNTVTSACEPSCRSAAQCNPSARGGSRPEQYALDFCNGSLGCQCDEGKCVGSLCSSDSDCGTQVCRNGACVPPPAASTVAKCQVTPDLVVMRQGSKARFWVSAWDAQNAPVVIKDGATWTAVGSTVTGSGTGFSAEFTAGNASVTTPTAAVQAAFGSTNCQAKVIVLPNPGNNEIGVSVIDELSGRPITGANVIVSVPTTGAIVQQTGNVDSVTTNAQGFASVAVAGNNSVTISVMHADFSYVTVANYAGTAKFLSFALRRNSLDKYGGYKGTFTNVPASSNVHAGLAGMSLAGSITNLNLTALLGPSVPTDVKIGSAIDEMDVPIPAGAFLGFGDTKIKDTIAGQGLNGTCLTTAGEPDEAKIALGTCGTRTAWALAGDVPLGDLPIDQVVGGLDNIDIGGLLGRIVPIFKKFNSSVVRDVQFELRPTPMTNGEPNFSDQSFYTTANHDFQQIPLAFNFVVKMPDLPRFKGTYVDGAAIIGGANFPGRGVIPLGIGVGVNTGMVDAQIDKLDPLSVGQIGVRMAPTHHGLEGSQYGLLVAAISAKALSDASAGVGASALFPRLPGNKLNFDPTGATPVDISGQAFPGFPETAKYNYATTADGALAGRSFRMGTNLTGVNVLRVSFADSMETRWDVLVDPASPGFTLPQIPAGLTLRDRTFASMGSMTRSTLLVQAFRMAKDPAATPQVPVAFNDYVELNDTNADRTTDFLTAFSFLDYGRPTVEFKTPSTSPANVARGSKIVISVGGFSIGTAAANDGVVRLSFTGGTGCADVILKTEVPMAGSGDLEHTLPQACTGMNVTVRAELLKPDETTPIAPAVSAQITANIQ